MRAKLKINEGETVRNTSPLIPVRCPRCETEYDPKSAAIYQGCDCYDYDGYRINPVATPELSELEATLESAASMSSRGMWRYAKILPSYEKGKPVTLGEGGTPLIELPKFAGRLGVDTLFVKNEAANPTSSHKDRLASVLATYAASIEADTLALVSTGNHGIAAAAYGALAGLKSKVYTSPRGPAGLRKVMEMHGASIVECPTPESRYDLLHTDLETSQGNVLVASNACMPPVGSHPYGVLAYRTIAYEIYEQLGTHRMPDVVLVPVAFGDTLSGIAQGFYDLFEIGRLRDTPRLIGVDVMGALAGVPHPDRAYAIVGAEPQVASAAFSVAVNRTSLQAVDALQKSKGAAVTVTDNEAKAARTTLARSGLFFELASCSTFAALKIAVATGIVHGSESVLLVATSSGLKQMP